MLLHDWLSENNISQEGLAKFLGCSIYAVKKWVDGAREPRWDQRDEIMRLTKDQVTPNDWHENRRAYEMWRAQADRRRRPRKRR